MCARPPGPGPGSPLTTTSTAAPGAVRLAASAPAPVTVISTGVVPRGGTGVPAPRTGRRPRGWTPSRRSPAGSVTREPATERLGPGRRGRPAARTPRARAAPRDRARRPSARVRRRLEVAAATTTRRAARPRLAFVRRGASPPAPRTVRRRRAPRRRRERPRPRGLTGEAADRRAPGLAPRHQRQLERGDRAVAARRAPAGGHRFPRTSDRVRRRPWPRRGLGVVAHAGRAGGRRDRGPPARGVAAPGALDRDLAAAVLERVRDQVVERLRDADRVDVGELVAAASSGRRSAAPRAATRARQRSAAAIASIRRLDRPAAQLGAARRSPRGRGRAARPAPARADRAAVAALGLGGEHQRLQRAAELVEALVERPPAARAADAVADQRPRPSSAPPARRRRRCPAKSSEADRRS